MHEPAHLTRRAVAAALPLAALIGPAAAAMPAIAPAGDDSALLEVGRKWRVAVAALHAHDLAVAGMRANEPDYRAIEAVGDQLFANEQRLFDAILMSPVRTLGGLALKAEVVARAYDIYEPGFGPLEAELARERCDLETHSTLMLVLDTLKLAGSAA